MRPYDVLLSKPGDRVYNHITKQYGIVTAICESFNEYIQPSVLYDKESVAIVVEPACLNFVESSDDEKEGK